MLAKDSTKQWRTVREVCSLRSCGHFSFRSLKPVWADSSYLISIAFVISSCYKTVGRRSPSMRRPKPRTKEQIIAALKAAARKLGHAPTSSEFTRLSGITINQVRERFSGYRIAVCAAGLKPNRMGMRVETAALLQDWAKAARAVGGVPSRREYERLGSYGGEVLTGRFQGWSQVPAAFSRIVAAGGLAGDWTDVLEQIRRGPIPTRGGCPDLPRKRLARKREDERSAYKARAPQST